jgi:hypothetical protein
MKLMVARKELKYHLTVQEAILLKSRLAAVMETDPYSQGDGYFVRSLYFDNYRNTSFYEKNEGLEFRKKYRLRLYDISEKIIKFEIKTKMNDLITKESALISQGSLTELMHGEYESLLEYDTPFLNRCYGTFKSHYYRPVVIIDYLRAAYYLDFNHIRVTFDSQLRKSTETGELLNRKLLSVPVLENNHVILEIKYNDFFPEWLSQVLETSRHTRYASSKYVYARMC